MSDEGYTDEALLHDGDESAGAIADGDGDNNGADDAAGGAANTSGGDDPELEAIKARVKQGGTGHLIGLIVILSFTTSQLNSIFKQTYINPMNRLADGGRGAETEADAVGGRLLVHIAGRGTQHKQGRNNDHLSR